MDQEYLIRNSGTKNAAHLWTGIDTECRMASTGGLRLELFSIHATPQGRRICVMCQNNKMNSEYAARLAE